MIDEFLQYLLTPVIAIILQVILLYVNYYFVKENSKLRVLKLILFSIASVLIFPFISAIVYQTVGNNTLGSIGVVLMFLQVIMNFEFIMEEYNNVNKKTKKLC